MIIGKIFRGLAGADFPYQAILVTPEVLLGEGQTQGDMPKFYRNTYATLKEIHHFIAGGEMVTSYNDSQFRNMPLDQTLLPDPIHIIGSLNENNNGIVGKIDELAEMAVSYLLSEIQTPMEELTGQPKV